MAIARRLHLPNGLVNISGGGRYDASGELELDSACEDGDTCCEERKAHR